ncbi:tyrosine--tRNA ligase [candidate division WWE3 bacterium RIFCSPLOWO2_01_FULL_42_11]|uniref:Tyrosine--tRNA ligase n=1 Tax=candidate division WWE3 bacterium RIFCSPLOWO2_01_FULL_42_11 TaxID=1802627 RepID=A0A1F4VR85_UNCKA|nr:MAG: tyrosine--tRNA ligase [candidate division WWE3 bacterium RIFCSPLOWO2_01_FULL_42_11]
MDQEKINEFLDRAVAEILPTREMLVDKLKKGPIRVYLGVDPTSPKIHLGNAVALFKLRQLQDMGHQVVLLIGSFTATIGDPSDKTSARTGLTQEQVNQNFKTYKEQASKILDFDKVSLQENGEWWHKMPVSEFMGILSKVTLKQVTERDLFAKRMASGGEVWMHELMYPMLQGYDSVVLDVDLEVGGTDQTFNMLMGRKLQKIYSNKEKCVLSVPLIMGTNGLKMSKSEGNTVDLTDSAPNMYGKLMSIRDEMIPIYAECCTTLPWSEVQEIKENIASSENPIDLKKKVAFEITRFFHDEKSAMDAQNQFKSVVQGGGVPSEMENVTVNPADMKFEDLLMGTGAITSRSEIKRLISGGGCSLDGTVITDPNFEVTPKEGGILKIGKRGYYRININE